MKELSRIQISDLPAQQLSEEMSLASRSGPQLPDEQVEALGVLMAQVQARYPNQTLPPETPDMYLMQWEEMVLKYGFQAFRDALSKVIQDSRFFPDPLDIRESCKAAAEKQREAAKQARLNAEWEEMKALYERERAEDIAAGIPRGKPQREISELLASARPPRTNLMGWTAQELRDAADKLDRGEPVELPPQDDSFEARKQRAAAYIRAMGVTREMIQAAREESIRKAEDQGIKPGVALPPAV